MKFIPFPPELAEASGDAAQAAYASRKGRRPGDHTTEGVACFRMPDGALRMADFYKPEYPEGAIPGLGTVAAHLEHYPNETSGYRHTVTAFTPAEELLAGAAPWANPAVAIITDLPGGRPKFWISPSESALAESTPVAGEHTRVERAAVKTIGMDVDRPPEAAVYMNPAHERIVLVGDAGAIAHHLVARFDVAMPDAAGAQADTPADGDILADVCERLNDRYAFFFRMAAPEDLILAREPDELEESGLAEPE